MPNTARITHYIDGSAWSGEPERTGKVYNPATGRTAGEIDLGSVDVVDRAVASSKHAWESGWRTFSLAKRTQILFRFRELLDRELGDAHGADVALKTGPLVGFGVAQSFRIHLPLRLG